MTESPNVANRVGKLKKHTLYHVVTVASLFFWGMVLYWAYTQALPRAQYGVVFLGSVAIIYLLDDLTDSIEENDWIDVSVIIGCISVMSISTWFLFTDFEGVYVIRQGYANTHEYFLAILIIITLLYLTWREFGNVFLLLVGGAILYAYYGYLIPGIAGHGGIPFLHILQQLVTDLAGFYGSITQIVAAWIAPFMLYAGLLLAYGAFDLILRIALVTSKYIKSGLAQTAVIGSALIGSINGSYAANAGMTGSITIPTMKDGGISSRNAAGIEAVASTSGQALPPVMGAAAFVMASFLGIRYVDIIIAGLIPAAIFVSCIVVGVHYTAIKDTGSETMDFDDYFDRKLTTAEKAVEGVRFGVPFLILLYTLGVLQWTVMTSALYTIIAMIVLGLLTPVLRSVYQGNRTSWFISKNDQTEPDSGTMKNEDSADTATNTYSKLESQFDTIYRFRPTNTFLTEIRATIGGFRRGVIILAPIAIIIAAINGVVDLFLVTGVPSAIAITLVELSGGVLLIAIVLGMAVSLVMGVGMPTVAAYIIVAILVAPTFINQFGIEPIAAHYMVFYAAILAGITPPVAPAAIITAGIAEANFWKTCSTALKISAPLFLLPMSFIYHPEIVSITLGIAGFFSGSLILMGGLSIIYGLNYDFHFKGVRRYAVRFGLFTLGTVVMLYPNNFIQAAGALLFIFVFIVEKMVIQGMRFPLIKPTE